LTHQPRRRQFGSGAARPMDRDYDFESGNAKFNKEDVKKEVAAQVGVNGTTEAGPSAAQLSAALAGTDEAFYDKGKSFFDNISCENKDRGVSATQEGAVNPNSWKRGEERKLNMETFGQASVDYGNGRFGRGGFRGGRGGFRGGRGTAGGYAGRGRGGYRGGYRANGPQSSSETIM
jgi:protein LSM14